VRGAELKPETFAANNFPVDSFAKANHFPVDSFAKANKLFVEANDVAGKDVVKCVLCNGFARIV
jgi:hypothetical protein